MGRPKKKRRRKRKRARKTKKRLPAAAFQLAPPEEGIQRFEFSADEDGPLGLRFSGGFPPMILEVKEGTFAKQKGMPQGFEVHAINGLELVQKNREKVMGGLKSRPVVLDVRPVGWMP